MILSMVSPDPSGGSSTSVRPVQERWHTFADILQRLHQAGILIHPEQLAEFFVAHGLPVDLYYVPQHLQAKALKINTHYQGDMARLELAEEPSW